MFFLIIPRYQREFLQEAFLVSLLIRFKLSLVAGASYLL